MTLSTLPIAVTLLAAALGAGEPPAKSPASPALPPAAHPKASPTVQTGDSLVTPDLVALDSVMTPGKPFAIGVRFKLAPHWHLYWRNPGDSGGAPGIEITVPAGFTVGPVEYPRPMVIEHPGEVTIGYESEVIYRIAITPPATLVGVADRIAIEAKLDWMVCSDRCLFGKRTVSVELPTRSPVPASLHAVGGEFPVTLAELGLAAKVEGATLVITGERLAAGTIARFIPDVTPGVSYGATVPPAVTAGDKGLSLSIPLTIKPQNALGKPLRVAGLITLTRPDGASGGSASVEVAMPAN